MDRSHGGWDAPILAVRQAEAKIAGDFEKDLSVPAQTSQMIIGRTAKGNATHSKGTSVVNRLLFSRTALLKDKADGCEPVEFPIGNT
jgi:hypothetical protein